MKRLLFLLLLLFPAVAQATTLTQLPPIDTTPFVGSAVSMEDPEGMAYVVRGNRFWLGDDQADKLYEVNAATGELVRTIDKSTLAAATKFEGTELAGTDRASDVEGLAYDPVGDFLYAFSTRSSSGSSEKPATVFRLTRNQSGDLAVDSWQPLDGFGLGVTAFSGAAFHRTEGLYVSDGTKLRAYTYTTNTLGNQITLTNVTGTMYGMGFSDYGNDFWVVTSPGKLYRVDWTTTDKAAQEEWNLVTSFGIADARAVEVVGSMVYVLDGGGDLDLTPFEASPLLCR